METQILAEWEVQEFIEQVQVRPSLWFGKDRLWVRKKEGQNLFAVKFVNGIMAYPVHAPVGKISLSSVIVKPLGSTPVAQEVCDLHVKWLLSKFTGYGWRKDLETYLGLRLAGWDEGNVDDIRDIALVATMPSSFAESSVTVTTAIPTIPAERKQYHVDTDAVTESEGSSDAQAPKTYVAPKSRYLQNLLKGPKR